MPLYDVWSAIRDTSGRPIHLLLVANDEATARQRASAWWLHDRDALGGPWNGAPELVSPETLILQEVSTDGDFLWEFAHEYRRSSDPLAHTPIVQ